MATREELYEALRNADKAGDTEGAAKLATYIQGLPAEPAEQTAAPPEDTGLQPPAWLRKTNEVGGSILKNAFGALAEPAAKIGSSMIGTPVAGLAGLGTGGLKAIGLTKAEPGNVVEGVGDAMTYEPRTTAGKAVTSVIEWPFKKLGQFADWAGGNTAEASGSPLLGAAVNTGIQMVPAIVGKGLGRVRVSRIGAAPKRIEPTITEAAPVAGESATIPAGSAARAEAPNVTKAREYVAARTSLDWNSLSGSVKTRLSDIAKDSKTLNKLDPAAVERQARLESLPVPITASTRGQLTRDPVQLRNEGSLSATEAGKPLREIHQTQTKQLLQNLDVLKGKTGGVADSPEQVGQSIQSAARAKLDLQKKKVSSLYKLAEAKGELQGSAPTKPLARLLEDSPDLQHLGWVDTWMKKADLVTNETGKDMKGLRQKASLKELEDLRQAAVARAMNGGTDGYYAGKVISAIDAATEGVGGSAYKSARAARKAQAMEFEEQGGVEKLVKDKSRTDRAIALENTWRSTVLSGSIEDLRNVKKSLLTGGDSKTKTAGVKAWRDIRAQTIQHIKDEATKSVTYYQDGTPNVTPASMQKAIRSVGPDKLEEIFGPGTVKQLNDIMRATTDLKTEPPTGFKGSATFANILAFLEKSIGKVPVLGDTVTGVVRASAKLREIGKSGREFADSQKKPLEMGVKKATSEMSAAERREAIARSMKFAPATQQQPSQP